MRHVVMTRSAYGPAWDIDANARRLDITRRITVPAMAAQTSKDWEWLVAIDIADPLAPDRMRAFESAGVPVRFIEVRSTRDRSSAAFDHYRAPWEELLGDRSASLAMTRIDDDDAFAPWALASIEARARQVVRRTVIIQPHGIRAWGGRVTFVRHSTNAWQTLVTPPGDQLHVYAYGHRDAREVAQLVKIDESKIAWLWSRHADTISGHREAGMVISDKVRALFPVDWSVFGQPGRTGPIRHYGQRTFR